MFPQLVIATVAGTFVGSALVTGLVRRVALSHGVLDVPNERSSHSTPTPRGGGLAVVVTTVIACGVLALYGVIDTNVLFALLGGGTAVAAVGLLDDRYAVPAGARFAVHVAAAAWALWWLKGLPPLRVGDHLVALGWLGHGLALLGIVWAINLFNFMDGIDGIAASEAVFVTLAAAGLALLQKQLQMPSAVGLVFAGACLGFLPWNWPAAKIFLGDVGSGYLGFFIAVLALAAARSDPAAVWVWLILGGAFFVDSTTTLVRRALRGDRVYVAHRSHAYQWLARRWRSHLKVTVAVALINLAWLLPCAAVATLHPARALWMVAAAFVPLVALALASGSGRPEPIAA
jgi:Fuc2NAc and GlcNAc transferase